METGDVRPIGGQAVEPVAVLADAATAMVSGLAQGPVRARAASRRPSEEPEGFPVAVDGAASEAPGDALLGAGA